MTGGYYLFVDKQYGPYDAGMLKQFAIEGRFTEDSWVFLEGETSSWTRASEVKSLGRMFQPEQSTPKNGLVEDISMGTMLFSNSASKEGVKKIDSMIPRAPLSDIPQVSGQAMGQKSANKKPISWWQRFFVKIFSKKK
jgi:hypothetical protein